MYPGMIQKHNMCCMEKDKGAENVVVNAHEHTEVSGIGSVIQCSSFSSSV